MKRSPGLRKTEESLGEEAAKLATKGARKSGCLKQSTRDIANLASIRQVPGAPNLVSVVAQLCRQTGFARLELPFQPRIRRADEPEMSPSCSSKRIRLPRAPSRRAIPGKASPVEAQKAPGAVRAADRNPRPPRRNGRETCWPKMLEQLRCVCR